MCRILHLAKHRLKHLDLLSYGNWNNEHFTKEKCELLYNGLETLELPPSNPDVIFSHLSNGEGSMKELIIHCIPLDYRNGVYKLWESYESSNMAKKEKWRIGKKTARSTDSK